jgi:hypothetical protein
MAGLVHEAHPGCWPCPASAPLSASRRSLTTPRPISRCTKSPRPIYSRATRIATEAARPPSANGARSRSTGTATLLDGLDETPRFRVTATIQPLAYFGNASCKIIRHPDALVRCRALLIVPPKADQRNAPQPKQVPRCRPCFRFSYLNDARCDRRFDDSEGRRRWLDLLITCGV